MTGSDIFNLRQSASPMVTPREHYPIWIESVWQDEDGTIAFEKPVCATARLGSRRSTTACFKPVGPFDTGKRPSDQIAPDVFVIKDTRRVHVAATVDFDQRKVAFSVRDSVPGKQYGWRFYVVTGPLARAVQIANAMNFV
jgi:hypothetical protein